MRTFAIVLSACLAACVAGCATYDEIRSDHNAAVLDPVAVPQSLECLGHFSRTGGTGLRNSIEDYGSYAIGYAEFDDQGWTTGVPGPGGQSDAIMTLLEREADRGQNVLVLVFAHGWHHDAQNDDCNVTQFRAMVRLTADATARTATPRKVIGVYVAWRGESVTVPLARQLTIYTRKNAAEHVAKGSVRELFARLKLFESRHRKSRDDPSVRTIVIGHSFGGLIAFHSLSQSLLEDIVFGAATCDTARRRGGSTKVVTQTGDPSGTSKWEYPDLVVLINPAFESSRYEALFQASLLPPGCTWDDRKRPRVITLAADNDQATGTFFPIVRWFATLLEGYNDLHRSEERQANLNVIGFNERYRTHRLRRCDVQGTPRVLLVPDPGAAMPDGRAQDLNSPLVVARATPDILFGHDGFLYSPQTGDLAPDLFRFLLTLYEQGQSAVQGTCDT